MIHKTRTLLFKLQKFGRVALAAMALIFTLSCHQANAGDNLGQDDIEMHQLGSQTTNSAATIQPADENSSQLENIRLLVDITTQPQLRSFWRSKKFRFCRALVITGVLMYGNYCLFSYFNHHHALQYTTGCGGELVPNSECYNPDLFSNIAECWDGTEMLCENDSDDSNCYFFLTKSDCLVQRLGDGTLIQQGVYSLEWLGVKVMAPLFSTFISLGALLKSVVPW